MKARLVGDKLIVDSRTYTTESLHELPEPLKPRNVSEKVLQDDDGRQVHFFEGKLSPLSNFHPSNFDIEGMSFTSVEQFYTYKKAKYASQSTLANSILKEQDPYKIKRLGHTINLNYSTWAPEQAQIMEMGIRAKFQQNPDLRAILADTKGRSLVECGLDKVWGIGMHLHHPDITSRTTWKGKNLLGEVLCKVRADFLK